MPETAASGLFPVSSTTPGAFADALTRVGAGLAPVLAGTLRLARAAGHRGPEFEEVLHDGERTCDVRKAVRALRAGGMAVYDAARAHSRSEADLELLLRYLRVLGQVDGPAGSTFREWANKNAHQDSGDDHEAQVAATLLRAMGETLGIGDPFSGEEAAEIQKPASAPEVPTCGGINLNGCAQAIRPEWSRCPHCGSALLAFEIDPGPPVEAIEGQVARTSVRVRTNSGAGQVALDAIAPLRTDRSLLCLSPLETTVLDVEIPPEVGNGRIELRLDDAVRRVNDDPFVRGGGLKLGMTRVLSADVYRVARQPVALRLTPEIVRTPPHRTATIRALVVNAQPGTSLIAEVTGAGWMLQPLRQVGSDAWDVSVGCGAGAGPGELVLRAGEIEERVPLRVLTPKPNVPPPSFVVGIDFGTSGISVAYRGSSPLSTVEVLPIDGRSRRDVVVFVPEGRGLRGALFGTQAEEQNRLKARGRAWTELKTAFADEAQAGARDGEATLVTRAFLKDLLVRKILPHLAEVKGQPAESLSVEWRFSMPVYDEAGREAYRGVLEETVRAAGFGRAHDRIAFDLEPEAAMRGARARHEGRLEAGGTIMVVDSGAGTTDICTGTIAAGGGLENVRSFNVALPRLAANGRIRSAERFGGGDVTRLAADLGFSRLGAKATEIILVAVKAAEGDGGTPRLSGPFFRADAPPHWSSVSPRLAGLFEAAKRKILGGTEEELPIVEAVRLAPRDVREAVNEIAVEYQDAVGAIGDDLRMESDTIVFVGGNSILPELRLENDFLGVARLGEDASDEERRLAVVRGLATATVRANEFVHPLRVEHLDAQGHAYGDARWTAGPETLGSKADVTYEGVEPGDEVVLRTEEGGRWYTLERLRPSAPGSVLVRTTEGRVELVPVGHAS